FERGRGTGLQGGEMVGVEQGGSGHVGNSARERASFCRKPRSTAVAKRWLSPRRVRMRAADPGPRPLLVMASRRLDPAAQLPRLLRAQCDEAEARPQLRARAGVVH